MTRTAVLLAASCLVLVGTVESGMALGELTQRTVAQKPARIELAQGYSCDQRRYCSTNISSCEEARWYLANCWWGSGLDRDNDGVPCESICPGG